MFLSDQEILRRGSELIQPFDPKMLQPASYDLGLYPVILVPLDGPPGGIDLRIHSPGDYMSPVDLSGSSYTLHPGKCILACTTEVISVPGDLVSRVEGKSTVARLFVVPQLCAGWLDPGFEGQVTLEIANHGPWSIVLYPGMPIAQVNFAKMSEAPSVLYGAKGAGSHYQGQRGPRAAAGKRGV